MVTKNVSPHALVLGNPARQTGWACKCGERLTLELECLVCGKNYRKIEERIVALSSEEK